MPAVMPVMVRMSEVEPSVICVMLPLSRFVASTSSAIMRSPLVSTSVLLQLLPTADAAPPAVMVMVMPPLNDFVSLSARGTAHEM